MTDGVALGLIAVILIVGQAAIMLLLYGFVRATRRLTEAAFDLMRRVVALAERRAPGGPWYL